jgi:hypothetical protein
MKAKGYRPATAAKINSPPFRSSPRAVRVDAAALRDTAAHRASRLAWPDLRSDSAPFVSHAATVGRAGRVAAPRRPVRRRPRTPSREGSDVAVSPVSPVMDATGRLDAMCARPRRECRALSTVARNVLWAVPAISATVCDAADTTPRAPATVAVRASAPMFAAPDTALRSTSRANCSAPTATIPTPSTAPRMTRGTTVASSPPPAACRFVPRLAVARSERAGALRLAMRLLLSVVNVAHALCRRNAVVTQSQWTCQSGGTLLRFRPARSRSSSPANP